MINWLIELFDPKRIGGAQRSSEWPRVRAKFLFMKRCAACDGLEKREVHHKKPFHQYPELELDESNLIVLCESKNYGMNCHLLIGHLGNYKRTNPNVEEDAKTWRMKLKNK